MTESIQNDYSKRITLEVLEKNMKVFLLIKEPDDEDSQPITFQNVQDILKSTGIISGINQDLIRQIIDEKKWNEKFLIAEGIMPTQGEPAKIKFFIDTDKSLSPHIEKDGHIDFRELHIVSSVEKDAPLVTKIPSAVGLPGRDVHGNELPALPGKDIPQVKCGKGTYKDPENELLIKSSCDGIIFYNASTNVIEVRDLFTVQGSVDYSTGNIHVKSSVEIKGDIKPGFSVTTPYNLDVKGVVEHAIITCGGNMKVQSGIIGDEKSMIKVGGDLNSGYINNQHVICEGSVIVNNEIRNSSIESGNEVKVMKDSGVILGGKITAKNTVAAASIGNIYDIHTEIHVGINKEFKDRYTNKLEELNSAQKELDELIKKISIIARGSVGTADKRMMFIKSQWQHSCDHIEKLKKEFMEIESAYFGVTDPAVYVRKKIYPNCIIKIKGCELKINDELSNVKFSLSDNEIIHSPIK